VQGYGRAETALLDAAALVGHLVPEGSVFAFLARHRREVFPPELFADLFPASTGRPSLPGDVAASVLVLQALGDLSDRDAVAAVRCDIRWKVACGLPLDHEGRSHVPSGPANARHRRGAGGWLRGMVMAWRGGRIRRCARLR
jgi:hypothetical protein